MHNFSTTQMVRKTVIETSGGLVASQHRCAAEAGAQILAAGGDAIDAAVAASFALGVVEPWMSGPTGGGMMTLWRAEQGRAETIEFGMRSPRSLNPADYPLEPERIAGDLFPWVSVKGDRNIWGATAVAVPGTVSGMELAHRLYGRLPWSEVLTPAIGLAREGMLVDWYASLIIASQTRQLAKDPDAAKMFLIDGQWPNISGWTAMSNVHLDQSVMAGTLERLAEAGARDFYEGDIARVLAADVQAKGGCLSVEDLATYQARTATPRTIRYRDAIIHAPSGLSAGGELVSVLRMMEKSFTPGARPDAASYTATAAALGEAYRDRLANAGDTGGAPEAQPCTTTFSVVDRHGNMVNVTQTLLAIFGSSVVSPGLGMLLNNGIMWFDPEPGKPNSLLPDKGCLMNICPTIGETEGRRFAVGASGGRKILPAVTHLISFMADFGMTAEEAMHQPRVDNSGGKFIVADEDLSPGIIEALGAVGAVRTAKRTVHPYAFGVPALAMRDAGVNTGVTEIMTPWGDTAHEDRFRKAE